MHTSSDDVTDVKANLAAFERALAQVCQACGRDPAEITLITVTKRQPLDRLREAYDAGLTAFGENQLQEALTKMPLLAELALTWHFIGAIQSNKTKGIATHFDWVHSVARSKDILRLNAHRPNTLPPLNVCIEVKCEDVPQRTGCSLDALPELAALIDAQPQLRLRGLMAVAPAPTSVLAPSPEDHAASPEDHAASPEDHAASPEDHAAYTLRPAASPEDHAASPEDHAASPEDHAAYTLRPAACPREPVTTFNQVAEAYQALKTQGYSLDVLSMGMSQDWPDAVRAGATHLRIGSALLGSRTR